MKEDNKASVTSIYKWEAVPFTIRTTGDGAFDSSQPDYEYKAPDKEQISFIAARIVRA